MPSRFTVKGLVAGTSPETSPLPSKGHAGSPVAAPVSPANRQFTAFCENAVGWPERNEKPVVEARLYATRSEKPPGVPGSSQPSVKKSRLRS